MTIKVEKLKKAAPFNMDEKEFESFQKKLQLDIKSTSTKHKVSLFYKENGINIKEEPSGERFEIKYHKGKQQVVRKL